jgi:hypothetical protein
MTWLPGTNFMAVGYDALHLYQVLLVAPAILYEVARFGRVHRAYVIGLGLFLPFGLATHFAWVSDAWRQAVAVMTGAGG